MLFLISPAKTLDYDTPVPRAIARRASTPLFGERTADLVAVLRRKSKAQVAQLMGLSDALAQLNVDRYAAWRPEADEHNSKPAVLAFDGDVYDGLQAKTMTTAELQWVDKHVVILSGLYGALRPLDRLQPYRLEMGTALATRAGRDLYAYWGDTVAEYLNQRQADAKQPLIVNLASQEYARVALRRALRPRVVECVFEDWKDGRYKLISFFAKRARGSFVRWAMQQRLRSAARLVEFDADGYTFDPTASEPDRLVFRRRLG